MKDKSKLTAIILVIVTIIVVVLSFIFSNKEEKENEINIVTNYSDFYTVNSCLYRVITYISSNDSETLNIILDDNYKKKNNINKNNVMNSFEKIDVDSTFVSKKMFYQKINENITKYYVAGEIQKNMLIEGENPEKIENKNIYFIVYLDSTSHTFSIEPYSGEIFIGGEKNE